MASGGEQVGERVHDEGNDVTERFNREALDALKGRVDTFETLAREQTRGLREAIDQLQESQEELGAKVSEHDQRLVDHDGDLRLLKRAVVNTDERLGRIEALLVRAPRGTMLAASGGAGVASAVAFLAYKAFEAFFLVR